MVGDYRIKKIPEKIAHLLEKDYDKHEVILYGGRAGGKSTDVYNLTQIFSNADNEPNDIIYGRCSYGSLGDSVFAEVSKAQGEMGLADLYRSRTQPYKLIKRDNLSYNYFVGLGGSRERTKGLKTAHEVSYIVFEEIQELKDREQLEQAVSSFLRNMRKTGKFIIFYIFNPPAWRLHWVNQWLEEKKKDQNCECIYMSWLDSYDFLSKKMIESILYHKIINPEFYNYLYLGNASENGGIYPMFLINKHKIDINEWDEKRFVLKIRAIVIGADFAVANDETCLCPLAILDTGQAVGLTPFIHNPKISGVIGTAQLCESYITSWWKELDEKFLITRFKRPVVCSCDIAGSDAIVNMRTFFGNQMLVVGCSKGTIGQMVGVVQSAMSKNMLYFLEEHRQKDYVRNTSYRTTHNLVAEQITTLEWNERQTGYKEDIPNDRTDALTYAVYMWFKNPANLNFINQLRQYMRPYYSIDDILKSE